MQICNLTYLKKLFFSFFLSVPVFACPTDKQVLLPESKYPLLVKTRKDLSLLTQLYDLYSQVLDTAEEWNAISWAEFGANKDEMVEKVEGFDLRCNKMPRKLRDWDAYKTLRHQIDDFKAVLPLLEELSKPSIEERHWDAIKNLTGSEFDPFDEALGLKTLLDAELVRYAEDVEEVTESADKERGIRDKLASNIHQWSQRKIEFQPWKDRPISTMRGVPMLLEELEEAQMELQTLLTMRHVTPYKTEVQDQLQLLSETTDTAELWLKVQMMWGNLESVFLGGDIARQLPREAKKFSKIDKDWQKIMAKAADTEIATECCANEVLKSSLPTLYGDLELCQRALEGYLEQKRNAFPRFYFCSNPVLLQILSQSSDPTAMQKFYEKVFDAIGNVTHHRKDKSIILEMKSRVKGNDEIIPFSTPVHDKGNVEDWLQTLLGHMRATMKDLSEFDPETLATVKKLTEATIDLHQKVKAKMLPTPAKFHYIFNLRDLSRVFQGILLTPLEAIKTGGSKCPTDDQTLTIVMCWRHECERVFCDKLTNKKDKAWYMEAAAAQATQSFPQAAKQPHMRGDTMPFVDFWREDVYDEDGILVAQAPKIYEPGGDMEDIKERVLHFMKQHNDSVKSGQLNLVMFDDALGHLLRIARILSVPRGSCLLVGVGGSGKQSLTRLAAYIARHTVFQITLTKTYGVNSLLDDIRELYKIAGPGQKKVTFLITDSEIKDERFLLYFNSILMTGDIGGLFAKEEIMGMCSDLLESFTKARPHLHPSPDNLRQFFIDTVRDNLHLVLCMSPANPKFPVRAQRFPGIINGVTIDWFLAWPQDALVEVSSQFLDEFEMKCTSEVKDSVKLHMGTVHQGDGNLLDDDELVGVLADTKAKAEEVTKKLKQADETKKQIDEKREQYRSVATRGSILYFGIVEMSLVNVMYQTSLQQFMVLFMASMDDAKPAKLANKRSANIIDTMTYSVYRYINQGLYETDRILFVLVFTMKIMVVAEVIPSTDILTFLRGGAAIDLKTAPPNPFGKWMSNEAYANCLALAKDSGYPQMKQIMDRITKNENIWLQWFNENEPEQHPIPDYENDISTAPPDQGAWLRLNLMRALRVDRLLLACRQFLRAVPYIGARYVDPTTDTVSDVYDRMTAVVPVIYLLSVGADPTDAIESLCRKKKNSIESISMGEGQEPVAERAIKEAAVAGTWVLLQNCELGLPLMDILEEMLIEKVFPTCEKAFRLFITAAPHPKFPLGLLQMCTKVTNEPPSGMRAGLVRSYTVMIDQDRLERVETPQWRTLLWGLCFFHSMIQERRKFGALGWCIPYEYNNGDLDACIMFLEKHLYSGVELSWPTIKYMFSQAQYGGKVTDDMDKRLIVTYCDVLFTPQIFTPEFHFEPDESAMVSSIPGGFSYKVPPFTQVEQLRAYGDSFPDIDNPEIYGMHPNADLTFRRKEGLALLETLSDTQPKSSGGGKGGLSREDVVYEKAGQLRERTPADFRYDVYMRQIRKQGGLDVPMNVFLYQEVQRIQHVIKLVRSDLLAVQLAIKGEVTMTQAILVSINELFDAKVPNVWMFTITGVLFSFMLPNISLWFSALQLRWDQWNSWLNNGRPRSFWMTGFYNPQGFLTAMKQEVTRAHRAQNWALDDVVYLTKVTKFRSSDAVQQRPDEGVYCHGLSIDGASWSLRDGCVVEAEPKKLFAQLPVLHVSATTKSLKASRESGNVYECPCYLYARRTDLYYIFIVDLPAGKTTEATHWILRGVALLCNTES